MTREEFLNFAGEWFNNMNDPKTRNYSLSKLEEMAHQAGMQMGLKLLEGRLADDPRRDTQQEETCPDCNSKLRIQNTVAKRTLKTILGDVPYQRPYCVCDRCGYTCAPMDRALGIPARGPSVSVLQRICHAGVVARSFEDGREILKVHSGLQMSRKHVRRICEGEGKRLVQQQAVTVGAFQEGRFESNPQEHPGLLVLTCDGGRIQTRHAQKEDRWKEDKVGAVYDAVAEPDPYACSKTYKGAKARTKTYVATMQSWEQFGWIFCMEAWLRGYPNASEKLFLADGAKTIREIKNLHFPDTVFILDWAHAAEHLNHCAQAALGAGTLAAQSWYQEHKELLWNGKIVAIIAELEKLSARLGAPTSQDNDFSPRKVLHRDAYSYFPNNLDAMDYPSFRAKGWPIGSGVGESAVKQFALRLKGSEKFWNIRDTGAEEMLALCALYFSEDDRWNHYWNLRN